MGIILRTYRAAVMFSYAQLKPEMCLQYGRTKLATILFLRNDPQISTLSLVWSFCKVSLEALIGELLTMRSGDEFGQQVPGKFLGSIHDYFPSFSVLQVSGDVFWFPCLFLGRLE